MGKCVGTKLARQGTLPPYLSSVGIVPVNVASDRATLQTPIGSRVSECTT